ncbi:hypothetical protein [Stenotrophomonas sp. GZD-301]|uniref:hypothetical protein n=1 Tax=Stenotrophomonas sp. GZD-301 TaxID=3404814 RepID=UPI003BB565F5
MDAIEMRARELWQQQYDVNGYSKLCPLAPGRRFGAHEEFVLRAIVAALTPPEGYVLVPVEPTKQMMDAAIPPGLQDQSGRRQRALWNAMLAARPGVF